MNITVREYNNQDLSSMTAIWNEVVEEGVAFPQEESLTAQTGAEFFAQQSHCGVAEDTGHRKCTGDFISFIQTTWDAVGTSATQATPWPPKHGDSTSESFWCGTASHRRTDWDFVSCSLTRVVKTNAGARHLYEKIGFKQLGVIPGGFRMKDGRYEDICPYYIEV